MSPAATTAATARAGLEAGLVERIVELVGRLDFGALAGLYSPDALFDANVPEWRYQLQGPAAIREQLAGELASLGGPARVARLRSTPTEDGVAVEIEARFELGGETRQWREVHVFHTDAGAITEHVTYCTGIWDAATIARQAVEAPMVRP